MWLIPFGGCKPRQDEKVLLKAATLPLNFWEVTGVGKVNCGKVFNCSWPFVLSFDDVQDLYDQLSHRQLVPPYDIIRAAMCCQDPQYENYMAESQYESLAAENWSTAASVAPQDQSETYQQIADIIFHWDALIATCKKSSISYEPWIG